MLALALLVLTAFADTTPTDCCPTGMPLDDAAVAYKTCSIDMTGKDDAECPVADGWVLDDTPTVSTCVTDTRAVADCGTVPATVSAPVDVQCSAYKADVAKCGDAGVDGGNTLGDDMVLMGCCGAITPAKTVGMCMCGEGLLNTYKTVTIEAEEMICAEVEQMSTQDECNEAQYSKDASDLACCVATADAEKVANPGDKMIADLKAGEEVALVVSMYTDDACTTLLYEMTGVDKLDTCVQSVDDDTDAKIDGQYEKFTVNDACDTGTTAYYTDDKCTVAKKDAEGADEKEEMKADNKCETGMKMRGVCEPTAAGGDGSSVSMISALIVLVAAAFNY